MLRVYYTPRGSVRGYKYFDQSNTNRLSFMEGLKDKFAALRKSEPEKSFIKAGILDSNENLTLEGQEVFLNFLLGKFGADFKTEIVDKILAADEADKKK